jgi:hypothetical protein
MHAWGSRSGPLLRFTELRLIDDDHLLAPALNGVSGILIYSALQGSNPLVDFARPTQFLSLAWSRPLFGGCSGGEYE